MQQSLWKDIEAQLQKFMKHLKAEDMDDMYSANCNHTPWQRLDYPTETTAAVPSMRDKVICTLMTRALYFANGWSTAPDMHTPDHSGGKTELKDFIRCGIVLMFMHILEESVCNSKSGISYAWHLMDKMGPEWMGAKNLIHRKQCTHNLEVHLQVGEWSMQHAVKKWLQRNADIQNTLKGNSLGQNCGIAVPTTKGSKQDAKAQDEADTLQKIKNVGGNLQKALRTVFKTIKKEVKEARISEEGSSEAESPEPESDDDDDEQEDANGKKSKATE
ncbi:hypothetical protein AK88_05506 [Plasmodium fragile]|uniref:Uncharacterized protein n=1 Tax=Plasmodium fragile TaxID=5857 RepID=A0A0D9QGK9_PLAFR|nr:uncharacterized protein AK88_05506 [Plasmodium fragile]KJP84861.1 hypothetical protein AK88_05506 [Plasmodium fragile]